MDEISFYDLPRRERREMLRTSKPFGHRRERWDRTQGVLIVGGTLILGYVPIVALLAMIFHAVSA